MSQPISYYDRFIPTRANMNMCLSSHLIRSAQKNRLPEEEPNTTTHDYDRSSTRRRPPNPQPPHVEQSKTIIDPAYQNALFEASFGFNHPQIYNKLSSFCDDTESMDFTDSEYPKLSNHSLGPRVLSFGVPNSQPKNVFTNPLSVLYMTNKYDPLVSTMSIRKLNQTPLKILDAPGVEDDYYLNLLDWGSSGIIAVAFHDIVYLYNVDKMEIVTTIKRIGDPDIVTSVSWSKDSKLLAVGYKHGGLGIINVETLKNVYNFSKPTQTRISSLSWNNCSILATSGASTEINLYDITREPSKSPISTLHGHSQEVCGLKWAPNGKQLASGGNDNLVNIWEPLLQPSKPPLYSFKNHVACVKAIDWCPWKSNLLASGGGTADRKIKFWNTKSGTCLGSFDTDSQVCSIIWSKISKELITSHGFNTNHLSVWKFPSMDKVGDLFGHCNRVLYTALSPTGNMVASMAGDETLRIWDVFEGKKYTTAVNFNKRSTRNFSSFRSQTKSIR